MVVDLARLEPPPAGFGSCGRCAYLDVGSAAICFACASSSMDPLPSPRCPVCEQAVDEQQICGNPICGWDDRGFDFVRAVSTMTGTLDLAIRAYKYDGRKGWAWVFGRVLVGFLDAHPAVFERFDVIAPSPTYIGEKGRSWDHIGLVTDRAAVEAGGRWPFDLGSPRIVVQTAPTESFAGKKWKARWEIADGPFRTAISVPDPERVRGGSVLLVDDVFTTGITTHVIGQVLRQAGAVFVAAVVLARQPFAGRS